jgi:hypothetical protein
MAVGAIALLSLPVSAQVVRNRISTVELRNSTHVAKLPYTAEYKTTRTQVLANGATITHESTEVVAVDSQGRRMTSSTTTPLSGDQVARTHVYVFNPVERVSISWNVPGTKATVMHLPEPNAARTPCSTSSTLAPQPHTAPAPMSAVERPKPVVEDLGTETIQGVETRGSRVTTITPAGTVGNDEPLVRTTELWRATAPGLYRMEVRTVSDDPQFGKTTKELVNFSQSEPDASVFQPPADYEIENKEMGGCATASTQVIEEPPPPPAQ